MLYFILFVLFVVGMWLFVFRNAYVKYKYRKRTKWVKGFTKLAENAPYEDIYEELKESSYEFKGTVYELIERSGLPDNEKRIATHYFSVHLDTQTSFAVNGKYFRRITWGISVPITILFYICFMRNTIYTERDLFIGVFILTFVNLIVQMICYFVKDTVFLFLEHRSNKMNRVLSKKSEKKTIFEKLFEKLDNLFS